MATPSSTIEESDQQLLRRVGYLVPLWTLLFVLASVGLLAYGDVLMSLFT